MSTLCHVRTAGLALIHASPGLFWKRMDERSNASQQFLPWSRGRCKILSRLLSLSDQEIKGILLTLSISILFEPASPAPDASLGFQWQPPSSQKAWAMPHFWGICQAQFTVAPDSKETFLPRLSADHLDHFFNSFIFRTLAYTLTLQSSSPSPYRVSALGHPKFILA